MANRYFRQFLLSQDARAISLAGSISLSAAAAVSSSDFNDLVESVTKEATGEYKITLKDKYVSLKSINLTPLSTEDLTLRIKSHDVSSAKTIVLETLVAGTKADVSAAAKIFVNILFKDSTAN